MKISGEEVKELKEYLDVENKKRKTAINTIMHDKNNNRYIDKNSNQKYKKTSFVKKINK